MTAIATSNIMCGSLTHRRLLELTSVSSTMSSSIYVNERPVKARGQILQDNIILVLATIYSFMMKSKKIYKTL